MPCACQGDQAAKPEPTYEVSLPDGRIIEVVGEHAARVEITKAGGGTYSLK